MSILFATLGAILMVAGFVGMVRVAPNPDGTPHRLVPTKARMRLWLSAMSGVMALGLAALYAAF